MYVVARLLTLLPTCVLLLGNLSAQQPVLEPDSPDNKPVPTVSFDLLFPGSRPAHYAIAVESTGKAAYRSDEIAPDEKNPGLEGDPYRLRFVVSEPLRTRIFELARQADYFKGDFNYTKNRVANTGSKTLTYGTGLAVAFEGPVSGVRNSTTYNYSENPAIQQLTTIFQSISTTLEFGVRLDHLRRFDKLGLDAELKRAEEMARQNELLELHAIVPVLKAIASDYRVLNVARQHAKNLLLMAEQTPSGGSQE